nr:hypothetical protein [Tanacetum cinerariifolium]
MDDLYNNLKIYEAEVIRSSSTTPNTQSVAFVSSNNTDSTNKAINTSHGVSAASSKTNASNLPNVDSLCDAAIYSFFASQSSSPHLDNENLKQIDHDDLKEMDLKRGHFARKCRASKHQDNRNRKVPRRTVPVEDTTSNALVTQCDRLGYDWSDQAKDGQQILHSWLILLQALQVLQTQTLRLEVYKKNEAAFEDEIKILKLNVMLRDKAITKLRQKFKKAKKEIDDLKLTFEKFEGSSKNLSRLSDSQQSDKSKTGLGYDSQGVDIQVLENQVTDKYNTCEGYHAVPLLETENNYL